MAPDWVPTQEKQSVPVDFRNVKLGPKGYKERRKRKLEEQEELETCPVDMEEDVASAPTGKRQKLADGTPYRKVSGKVWKGPAQPATKVMKAPSKKDWDKKMAEKRAKQAFKEQKDAAQQAIKDKRKAKARERQAAKERKEQNQKKSAVVQKITNAATVKKMMKSKKQRKLIKTADTN